jgi:hypothetical protein
MTDWFTRTFLHARTRAKVEERANIVRLERAEQELRDLQERGDRAMQFLAARGRRNHWRESIEQMIQGV